MYQFVLAMVLAVYVGFSRLNHLQFLKREPMLAGILNVGELPPQCTFWRFLNSLPLVIAQQLLEVQRVMRQRVPLPLRANRVSGSVVEVWVSLRRSSPWKSTVGLPGSS